jgi:hypothetical protein
MAGFVLYLLDHFALRCRMVEFCSKAPIINLPAGNVEGDSAMDGKEALSSQHSAISQNHDQNQKQNQEQQQRQNLLTPEQRAEVLVRKIGEACDELERLAEENPELVGRVAHGSEEHKDAYLRLKARLELADEAPRCRWVRQDGTSCGSPQMKKHIYCFAHRQMMEARALVLSLPAPEDANAIQIGIMRIQKALIEGTISTKTAGLLLYSMQLALQNVGQVTFGQAKTQELVSETVDEEVAFSQNQTHTKETRRHGEETGLPRMGTDGRGLEMPTPVEFRPTKDMFRMDTREGREAYEASLRRKNRTSGDCGIGTPPRAAVPHEDRQMHANQG